MAYGDIVSGGAQRIEPRLGPWARVATTPPTEQQPMRDMGGRRLGLAVLVGLSLAGWAGIGALVLMLA